VRFTPEGGTVTATAGREDGEVRIAVRDTGPGIAVEDHERIFEKFERIAGPATPGTGLGLSISRELAHLHGGDLTVESTLGLGSTFTVTIPLADG
jgi:signal transduction histidine kinase